MPEPGRAISPLPTRSRWQSAVSPLDSDSAPSLGGADGLAPLELDTIGDGLQIRSAAIDGARIKPLRQPAEIVPLPQRATPRPERPAVEPEQTDTAATREHQPSGHRARGPGVRGLGARGLAVLRDPRLKRAVDFAGSLALLGALTPVLGVCAAAVRLSSPGPILFRQKRIGRSGEPFEMLKFRTMHHDADQTAHQQYVAKLIAGTADAHDADGAAVFKIVGDRRITPAGHWLRRLSLDELPQLINVLRGDMSLVGPRPPLPYEVEHYTPRHLQRLEVTPGITGLWQVSGRSRTTFEEMIDLDLAYIERWSVSLDLQILLRTIPVVVFPDGL